MDVDYYIFAVLMVVLGTVGMSATVSVSPNFVTAMTGNGVASPATMFQELSVVLLAIGAIIAPIGLVSKSAPKIKGEAQVSAASDGVGLSMRSPRVFFLGVTLVIFGVAMVIAPSYLILKDTLLIGEGAGIMVLGVLFGYAGGRS